MKPWMEHFIRLCLAKIPDPSYRRRLAGELSDHLAALSADLEAGGLSPGQAQALALERMGSPQALSRQFYARWRRHIRSPRYIFRQLALGCCIAGLSFLAVFLALGAAGLTHDAAPGLSMEGSPALTAAVGAALFLLPFSLEALWLTRRFQGHPRPRLLTLAGLLLAWLGELGALLLLGALLYGIPLGEPASLLARISGGGDPIAPWFTAGYRLLTLAGCGVLSLLAPLLPAREEISPRRDFFHT